MLKSFQIVSGISEWLGQKMTGRAAQEMKYFIIQCTLDIRVSYDPVQYNIKKAPAKTHGYNA